MKYLKVLILILFAGNVYGQEEITVTDDVSLADTLIDGQIYYKAITQVVTETEYLDSASFLNSLVVPIYNEYYKRRQAIRLNFENSFNRVRIQNQALIDSITGSSYFDLIINEAYENNVVSDYSRIWRLTYDTLVGVFLYWDGSLINGQVLLREIDNAGQMLNNGDPPSYVAEGVRARFNPYNNVLTRMTLLLWNGASYDNVWSGFEDVGLMGPIFDDEGRNTGRSVWSSDNRVRTVRLLRFPPLSTE